AQRGFLLTHDTQFQLPFDRAQRRINGYLYDLSQDITPGPRQQDALNTLKNSVGSRLSLLNKTQDLAHQAHFEDAAKLIGSGDGFALSEQIRKVISDMENVENQELLQSVHDLDFVNEQSLTFSFFSTLLASGILVLAFLFVSRQLNAQQAESELERRERETLNAMLATMGDGVLIADRQGQFLIFNPAAQEILGKGPVPGAPEELAQTYGLYNAERTALLAPQNNPMVRALKGESVDELEMYVKNEGSPGVYVSATTRTLVDQAGEPRAGILVLRDVTQRKLGEQRLNEFYAILSHELRTPLTSIRGSLGLLEGGVAGPLSEMAQELIGIARTEVDRLIRLVNNILDLKKIEAGKLQLAPVEIKAAMIVEMSLTALKGLAHDNEITFAQDIHSDRTLKCDEDRIIQVLTNLVSNAIKFSSAGGTVKVSLSENGDMVRFSVTDKGPGIAKDHIPQLFGKFQQLNTSFGKRKGTGLGLAISKALVEQHGGRIGVDSAPGLGSTFWFELPITYRGPGTGTTSGGMPAVQS
ncbi:MAG: ATP-binding protein, partial [Terriglobales bacterium]